MKHRLIFVLLLLLVFVSILHTQAAIKKFPGENVTVTWTNPATDDPKVTGWRIYAAASSAGPYTFTGVSVTATARQAVVPAAFSTNSVMVFYGVKAFLTAGTTTVESDVVPVAGVEVDMNVVLPVGVQVR